MWVLVVTLEGGGVREYEMIDEYTGNLVLGAIPDLQCQGDTEFSKIVSAKLKEVADA